MKMERFLGIREQSLSLGKKKLFLLAFMVIVVLQTKAQDPVYSLFYLNKMALNPAYAGANRDLNLSVMTRMQWTGVPGKMQTTTASLDIACPSSKLGFGAMFYNDQAGEGFLTKTQGTFLLSANLPGRYSRRIGIRGLRGRKYIFSAGLSYGVGQRRVDWSTLVFSDQIDEDLLDVIQEASLCAAKVFGRQLKDLIASYTTLLIEFDPLLISPWQAEINFQKAWEKHCLLFHTPAFNADRRLTKSVTRCIDIPVYYHPSVGWDLKHIAQRKGITWQQVVECHQQKEYRVYALGFAPGFAFMGQLDPLLEMPRRSSPRTHVPAGSVAISDRQTAVYPSQSPGGWNIIGRSPSIFFDSESLSPSLLKAADRVRFKAITKTQFIQLGGCLIDVNTQGSQGER